MARRYAAEDQILARLLSGLQGAEEYGVALDEYDIDKLTLNGEAPPIYLMPTHPNILQYWTHSMEKT